ncbi:outer membrane protein assembly factor BamA [Pelagibacteraceae bacterium]|nr:outer membrane protein assembly factor BamA [Pelagibacteraceae bacterium]
MHKFIILTFLLLSSNLSAEVVNKLIIEGNNRISDETVKVYGEIDLNQDYSAYDIDKILKNLYKTDFFKDIQISLNDGVLNINLKEYAVLNSIDLLGEPSSRIKKGVLKTLQLKPKSSFIESKVTEDINAIKKMYGSLGYNFVNVSSKVEYFDQNRVNLIYTLKKGNRTDIEKINFIGDKKIKEKRLRDIIVSEEKKFWKFLSKNTFLNTQNIELDKNLLINYYKSLGYYDVQVLSENAVVSKDNLTSLTYTINAGKRYRISKVSTNVAEVIDKNLFLNLEKSFTKTAGKYYSPFTVKKLLDEVDLLMADNDLQFVEHSVNEIIEGETIEIKINIFEGKKLLVEKINIIGNAVTDEAIIRSELLLDEGDPFNSLKLDQSIAKIMSRNIFAVVDKTVTNGSSKDQKIIDIKVEEQPTGEISAGAGIGTTGGAFQFSVSENNWLGKGIRFSTALDVSKETFTGSFSVFDPNYKFSGNSLNYYASNTTNDIPTSGYKNNILTTGIGTSFEQYKNVYLSPSISFSHDDLKVKSTASDALKKQKGTFSDLSFSYGLSLDNRDRVYAPTDGYISSFNQKLPIYADSPYLKNSFKFKQYKSFSPDVVGSFKFFASAINGLNDYDVRISKRQRLPGSQLRGFKAGKLGPKDGTDYIGGNYAAATSLEMSLPNLLPESTKTDIGLFVDAGNLWGVDYNKDIDETNKIRSSTGATVQWSSPLGPMSFVFSQNLTKATSDQTEAFNFRLGTTF